MKKAQFANLTSQLNSINQVQREHRANTTQAELEQIDYLQTENVALQRELAKTIEGKRIVMADIGRENMDFQVKYAARVTEKDALRQQIGDIEHLIRQLKLEIEQTTTET